MPPAYRERRRELDRARPHRTNRTLASERIRDAVRRAVARGDLVKPARCEGPCGRKRIDSSVLRRLTAHHDDHRKVLAVQWLCPACHSARHAELGRVGKRK